MGIDLGMLRMDLVRYLHACEQNLAFAGCGHNEGRYVSSN